MRKILLCSALALFVLGCKDGTSPSTPAAVTVSPGAVAMNAIGATQVVRASVTDAKGKAMRGATVTWTSSSAAVSVAGAGGDSAVVTALGNGGATVTATSGSASGTLAVQVAQVAAALQKPAGDEQTGAAGVALPQPLVVGARDRLGAPVPGVAVSFLVVGGGSLSTLSATTGADGNAAVTWTLGTGAGTTQTVIASAAGLGEARFNATAVAGPPSTAAAAAGDNQGAQRGTAVAIAPRVLVRDAFGNGVAGISVQFAVTAGGGSVAGGAQTTDVNGTASAESWTLGQDAGTNTLTASFPATSLPPVVFTATAGDPGTITISAGHNQAAMVGTAVAAAPAVQVRDPAGNPLSGMTVTFTVSSGGGTVGNATAVTDAGGIASAGSWVLGPVAGPNTLSVSVQGLAVPPAVFRGIGCAGRGAGYAMTLCFTSSVTASQRQVFVDAAARWASIITADLPDLTATIPASSCGTGSPSLSMTIDDLVIFAAVEHIDGPGQVLGQAGWCYRRSGGLPIVGLMRFDAADVANLEAGGQFSSVILHEMGHVLGIGTLWNAFGLLHNPSSAGSTLDTYFSGAGAIAGFDAVGGSTYTAGQKVPVENTGGPGTINGHWRESVLGRELMTGFLNSGVANPLSLVTVRSLADLGYVVDVNAADAYMLSLQAGGAPGATLRLHNDLYTGPRYTIDRQGRRTRIPD